MAQTSPPAPQREALVDAGGTVLGSSGVRAVVPSGLDRYAAAFLTTRHDEVRFLWRPGDPVWLTVALHRARTGHGGQDVARVRWSGVEMPEGLTAREVDVLTLVCLGLTNHQIAMRLGTSARTVSSQVERLLTKLGQTGRAGLAALAVELDLLRLPVPGGVEDEYGLAVLDVERAATAGGRSVVRQLRRRPPRPAPLHIGSVLPLTGQAWADGIEGQRGAELAVAQINARGGVGGRPLEHVVVSADFFEPAEVIAAFRSLLDLEVDAVMTSYASADCPEVLDLVADFGRPFLHTATFEQQVQMVREDRSRFGMVFQTCPSETHYGVGFVRLLDELRAAGLWRPVSRTIVALELETNSTRTANESFFRAAEASGWVVGDVVPIPVGDPDWVRIVERVNRSDPAAVMITHFVPQSVADFQRAFRDVGNGALAYGIYGPSIPHFAEAARDAAEGMLWSSVTGTYDDVFGRAFRREYEQLHGTPAGLSQAGAAYDRVRLLSAAWAATGSADESQVLAYLRSAVHRGVNGVYYLGGSGQSALSYPDVTPDPSLGQAHTVFQVQSGRSQLLGPAPYGDLTAFRPPPAFRRPA